MLRASLLKADFYFWSFEAAIGGVLLVLMMHAEHLSVVFILSTFFLMPCLPVSYL